MNLFGLLLNRDTCRIDKYVVNHELICANSQKKIVSRICPGLIKNKTQLIDNQFVGLRGPTWA